jgi:hypothetical protein
VKEKKRLLLWRAEVSALAPFEFKSEGRTSELSSMKFIAMWSPFEFETEALGKMSDQTHLLIIRHCNPKKKEFMLGLT